jgi:hypothetical protein
MISVILYGRNDNYGHNLHKRAALSLNCFAELLDAPDDEILFVDYNTPDDLPSFPESIRDTLTARARARLRILRVRPRLHRRFAARTPLPVLEAVARNVALRRANAANRWVLSSNTDMILAPPDGRTLTAIARGLPDRAHHIPRFELPQSLWESLDRGDPGTAMARAGEWGRTLHLDEVVTAAHPSILYDAPGDFQLLPRADLLRIQGFDERILLGWHIDSNIARRVFLLRGDSGDLAGAVHGYHCEHTRQVTPKHAPGRRMEELAAVTDALQTPFIPEQQAGWGLAGERVEEIRLHDGDSAYLRALRGVIGGPLPAPGRLAYTEETRDRTGYDPRHVLPFLMDALVSCPRDLELGWFGSRRDLLELAAAAWRTLGFARRIRVAGPAAWLGRNPPDGAAWAPAAEVIVRAQACVFDFGAQDAGDAVALHFVATGLRSLAAADATRGAEPCRVIAVNAVNSRFEGLVDSHVGVTLSPITTRIRQGFVFRPPNGTRDLLPALSAGDAGRRTADRGAIEILAGRPGCVCFGPYIDLRPGDWLLELEVDADLIPPGEPPLALEAVSGETMLGHRRIGEAELRGRLLALQFSVPAALADAVLNLRAEFRLHSDGRTHGFIRRATLRHRAAPVAPAGPPTRWLGRAARALRGGG